MTTLKVSESDTVPGRRRPWASRFEFHPPCAAKCPNAGSQRLVSIGPNLYDESTDWVSLFEA